MEANIKSERTPHGQQHTLTITGMSDKKLYALLQLLRNNSTRSAHVEKIFDVVEKAELYSKQG